MLIDYSQHGYKEMFANYGLTALAAQGMEKILFILLAAVECLETRKVSKNDLYKVFDKHDRRTLGQIINTLRKKVAFPQKRILGSSLVSCIRLSESSRLVAHPLVFVTHYA